MILSRKDRKDREGKPIPITTGGSFKSTRDEEMSRPSFNSAPRFGLKPMAESADAVRTDSLQEGNVKSTFTGFMDEDEAEEFMSR